MRERQSITLVLSAVSGLVVSIGWPSFFAENQFLVDFVNHEYINILAVLVTVSMVSVVQIHLEYTRIERRFQVRVFGDARRAVNASAVVLFNACSCLSAIVSSRGSGRKHCSSFHHPRCSTYDSSRVYFHHV